MRKYLLFIAFILLSTVGFTQPDLSYYLPEGVTYDPKIPTPKSIIGHEVGEWHISHDRLVTYMMALDAASDRISLEITGYTHEARPLLLLTITSPKNHQRIEEIRNQHVLLADPTKSASVDTKVMPAVFYLGHSIHGNEPSGSNAALLNAYHLAAAQGDQIDKLLDHVVILLDPSFNPDGLHRFSSWANSRKSKMISTDPYDTEHNEAWPGGRTNHYWFDLNRDWMVAQQPESQARIKQYQKWKPNVLTDHHEMGTNSTFFFQPGVPARVHPLTPNKNQELTHKIGEYHAKALDNIGSLYYTKEGYDDYYYGKGSAFPDVQGAIGILFEQASSRGHAQDSENGVVEFPFTIRNQFTTALSTMAAVEGLREELLNYQRDFYKTAASEASKDPVKSFVFGSKDKARAYHLAELVSRQDIKIYKLGSNQTINGKAFDAESSYVIPMNQPQYKLIKGMFERRTQFEDSLFYDISTWTLSLAFGVEHEEAKTNPDSYREGALFVAESIPQGKLIGEKAEYAYVMETYGYYAPRALYRLLKNDIRVKVATEPFYNPSGKRFERGALMIPISGQKMAPDQIEYFMNLIMKEDGIDIYSFNTGLDYKGVSLGSNSFEVITKPTIAMLVDGRVSSNDAGEIWHLLDARFQVPVTLLPVDVFNRADLRKYNTIILPTGNYNDISNNAKEKLKDWVQGGGVLIGFEDALTWMNASGFGNFEMKKSEESKGDQKPQPYAEISNTRGAQQTSGAIFEASVDLTNPLLYGYYNSTMPMFKSNNLFMEKAKGAFANPLTYGSAPLLSGYISKQNYPRIKNSSGIGIAAMGQGRVIGFTENLAFRAFWFGNNKMLMNAIFYGRIINSGAAR